tara:strand:+ start:872 stop:1165 length:294 start_codon:yes stop_codon:yes gene_type:complete
VNKYQELQLELLQYESMIERRDAKIRRLKDVIKAQDENDCKVFRCWQCKSELIWGGDHDVQEVYEDERSEGIVSNFTCSNYDCNTHVEVYHIFDVKN